MSYKSFSCFKDEGRWLKGNLHSHTTNSDGDAQPQELVDWYQCHGYDFLAITDHDVITDVNALDGKDMLLIHGIEFGYAPEEEPGFFLDMLGINIKKIPEFLHPDEKGHIHYDRKTSPQEIIDYLNETGGMAIMCHPYFMINMTEPYLRYHSYLGLEAFNFVCEDMCGRGNQEIYWDCLLYRGRKPLGFCTDDSHSKDFGHAWIEVKAKEKTVPAILEAISQGSYYSTTGIKIFDVDVKDGMVEVTFDRPCNVVFQSDRGQFVRAYDNNHAIVNGVHHFSAKAPILKGDKFLRIELIDEKGKKAYTNPVFMGDEI